LADLARRGFDDFTLEVDARERERTPAVGFVTGAKVGFH
jgi:hypothetical protein